jgi:hypothetical protein
VESFALTMAAGARDGHLTIFLLGRPERAIVRSLGLDGRARLTNDDVLPVAATWNAIGGAHVGAFVQTTVRQTIRIRDDGSAVVDAEILFENGAGTDPPSVLLGRPVSEFPVGTFAADVTLLVPSTAENVSAETSRPSPIEFSHDLGLTAVTGAIVVRGDSSETLTVTYVVPDLVQAVEGEKQVTFRVLPQPTLDGVRFQLKVVLPDGSSIRSASPGLAGRGSAATFSGVRGGPVDLVLRFGASE